MLSHVFVRKSIAAILAQAATGEVPLHRTLSAANAMLALPVETWVRLVVWMVLVLTVYGGYGYRHTRVRCTPVLQMTQRAWQLRSDHGIVVVLPQHQAIMTQVQNTYHLARLHTPLRRGVTRVVRDTRAFSTQRTHHIEAEVIQDRIDHCHLLRAAAYHG